MVDSYDEGENPFTGDHRFRYQSCLLWVDVEEGVLAEQLDRRMDDMVGMGMEELESYFACEAERDTVIEVGLPNPLFTAAWTNLSKTRISLCFRKAVPSLSFSRRNRLE
ncbi:hypothetical protein KSP40_PGU021658 [Platanthera guangdongensis]|uniref:Uncharacterized protein n=1 Tax=Platanthera guangdongensis TaxID=2320717 RepID=A0ABR2MTL9_9ASPA